MFKFEFKETTPILLVLGTGALLISILGVNPLDTTKPLALWAQICIGLVGGILLLTAWLSTRNSGSKETTAPVSRDYIEKFNAIQEQIRNLTPDDQILSDNNFGKANFITLNSNITEARTDIVVSSDDNRLSARGGVAKAIREKLGVEVEKEIGRLKLNRFRQGQIAITTGGNWGCRAVFHAAVIDLDENRYPTPDVIKTIVRRVLECSIAIGATSIAFPVLGGGTGSVYMSAQESVRAMVVEIGTYLDQHKTDHDGLTHVELYIFNRADAEGIPPEMRRPRASPPVIAQGRLPGHLDDDSVQKS